MPARQLSRVAQGRHRRPKRCSLACVHASNQDLPGNLLVPLHRPLVLDDENEIEAGQDRALQVNVFLRSFQVIIPANTTACLHKSREAGLEILLAGGGALGCGIPARGRVGCRKDGRPGL